MDEIHYLIGNKCNLNCEFCFWDNRYPDSSFELKKKIIDEIIKSGIKKVTLSGGEPTLAKDFLKILKYMHSKNLEIILHTNGIAIDEKNAEEIAKYVSRISLSLDGSNNDIQNKMRKHNNFFRHTLELIDIFTNLKKEVNVKTCVTKQNIGDLINIGKLLSKKPISYWSLLQFHAINKANINKDKYFITNSEFDNALNECKTQFPNIIIKSRNYEKQDQKYCFIASDGKVYTYIKDKGDILIGDLEKDSLKEILKNIQ